MKPRSPFPALLAWALLTAGAWASVPGLRAGEAPSFETAFLRFALAPETGRYEILDKPAGVVWRSNPYQARFGEVTLSLDGKPRRVDLAACEVRRASGGIVAVFHPLAEKADAALRVSIRPDAGGKALEFAYDADPALGVETVRLLDEALWGTDRERGEFLVPCREGLLVPADSGLNFTHRFDTFAYEGCHMEMLGLVKSGAAALVTWHDPYVAVDVRSAVTNAAWLAGRQAVSASLALRKSAKAFRVQFLGKGGVIEIARAYRQVAKSKGWLVTWDQKLKENPERAKYFGASNFKLWSTLSRTMSEDSRTELSVRVNWTFDEAAQVAEHLQRDLQLDHVLFISIQPASPSMPRRLDWANCDG